MKWTLGTWRRAACAVRLSISSIRSIALGHTGRIAPRAGRVCARVQWRDAHARVSAHIGPTGQTEKQAERWWAEKQEPEVQVTAV